MKYYNNTLIKLLRGYIGNSTDTGNDNIDILLSNINNIITTTEMFDNTFASNDYRDLQFLLEYIAKNNTDLRSNIDLRKELLLSYDKTINDWEIYDNNEIVDAEDLNYINDLFEDIVYKVAEMPTDIISYGQAMMRVHIENGRYENQMPSYIEGELLNQTMFQRYKDGFARVYNDKNVLEQVKIIGRDTFIPADKYGYIYKQDNELFTGGVLKTLLLLSLFHLHNNNEWANFNTKLKGILAAQYDFNKLYDQLNQMQEHQKQLFGKSKKAKELTQQFNDTLEMVMDDIKNAGKNRVTVVPNSIEVKQFDVVGTQGYGSFKEYDFLCKQLYENTYIGQAGRSLVANAQSYSGSGLKALQSNTQNKEQTDRRVATKIMNQILNHYWAVWKGNNNRCPLRFRYGVESNEDASANLKIFNDISNMNINISYKITPADFCKKLGIPYNPKYYEEGTILEIGGKQNEDITNQNIGENYDLD